MGIDVFREGEESTGGAQATSQDGLYEVRIPTGPTPPLSQAQSASSSRASICFS